jgi:hypothetical protein
MGWSGLIDLRDARSMLRMRRGVGIITTGQGGKLGSGVRSLLSCNRERFSLNRCRRERSNRLLRSSWLSEGISQRRYLSGRGLLYC